MKTNSVTEADIVPPAFDDKRPVEDVAADWCAYHYSGVSTAEDETLFAAWLSASPDHREVYGRVEQAWRDIGLGAVSADMSQYFQETKQLSRSLATSNTGTKRWFRVPAIAAGLLAIIGGTMFYQQGREEHHIYASAVGETRELTLSDGSQVTLAAASKLDVTLSNKHRKIVLAEGRAYFDVMTDLSRPFTVSVANSQIDVLGTAFDVNKKPSGVQVTVSEGEVKVAVLGAEAQHYLDAGQQASVSPTGVLQVEEVVNQAHLSWRTGLLEYVDVPLRDVVAELNRYRPKKIQLMSSDLGDLHITMAVPVDKTDVLLSGLKATKPVEILDSNDSVIIKNAIKSNS